MTVRERRCRPPPPSHERLVLPIAECRMPIAEPFGAGSRRLQPAVSSQLPIGNRQSPTETVRATSDIMSAADQAVFLSYGSQDAEAAKRIAGGSPWTPRGHGFHGREAGGLDARGCSTRKWECPQPSLHASHERRTATVEQ